MPLCCLPCCCSKEEEQDSKEDEYLKDIDKYMISYVIKNTPSYKPPKCPLARRRIAYEVQWGHLHATSSLLEFEIQPNPLYDDFGDTKRPEVEGKSTENSDKEAKKDNASPVQDAAEKDPALKDNAAEEEVQKEASDEVKDGPDHPSGTSESAQKREDEISHHSSELGSTHFPLKSDEDNDDTADHPEASGSETMPLKGEDGSKEQTSKKKPSPFFFISKLKQLGNKKKSQTKTATKEQAAVELEKLETKDSDKPSKCTGRIDILPARRGDKDRNKDKKDKKLLGRELCLFKTEYTNTSGVDQGFTFHTERRTKSSVAINIQRSYKIGGKLNISLKLPVKPLPGVDPLNVTGTLCGELQVTKSRTKTFESEQVWSVDNVIKVKNNTKAVAEMKVIEEEALATFKIKHLVTPVPEAMSPVIPVYVLRKKDLKKPPEERKVLDVLAFTNHNFYDAFENDEAKAEGIKSHGDKNNIEFVSEGVIHCVYQARQVIDVKTSKIGETSSSKEITYTKSDSQVCADNAGNKESKTGNELESTRKESLFEEDTVVGEKANVKVLKKMKAEVHVEKNLGF